MLGVIANVLLVNPTAVPVNSLAELIALAKKKPGDISYGSNGPGSFTHLTTAILAHQAGAEFLHVPYQGAAPLMTDLLAGRIGMTFTAASAALPLVQSGQLRALAVTTGQRSRFSPDIPTLVESGFPSLDAPVWFGVVVRTLDARTDPRAAAHRVQCGDHKRRLCESAGKKFHGGPGGSAGCLGSVSRQGAQALVGRREGDRSSAGLNNDAASRENRIARRIPEHQRSSRWQAARCSCVDRLQGGLLDAAAIEGVRAAGVEPAPLRRIDRARNVALEDDALARGARSGTGTAESSAWYRDAAARRRCARFGATRRSCRDT